jgi:beta-galactosidase
MSPAVWILPRPVAHQSISSNRLPKRFELKADADKLLADGADMVRLVFRITDEFGNPLPSAVKIVEFDVVGEADLIGDNPFTMIGGQAAVYLKARYKKGTVTIRARAEGLPEASVSIEIVGKDSIF